MCANPLTLLGMLLSIVGVSSVPASTQWKLCGVDWAKADFAQLRFALPRTEWATPTPERTHLVADIMFEDGAPLRKLDIVLRRGDHAEDKAALAQLTAESSSFVTYEIAPRDLSAIRALQAEVLSLKAAGRKLKGNFAIDTGVACRKGDLPEGPLPVDFYVHATNEIGWAPLLQKYDIRDGLKTPDDMSKFEKAVPLCESQTKHAGRAIGADAAGVVATQADSAAGTPTGGVSFQRGKSGRKAAR